jgi:hypothetical protein
MIPRLIMLRVNGTWENSKIVENMYMGRADLLRSSMASTINGMAYAQASPGSQNDCDPTPFI